MQHKNYFAFILIEKLHLKINSDELRSPSLYSGLLYKESVTVNSLVCNSVLYLKSRLAHIREISEVSALGWQCIKHQVARHVVNRPFRDDRFSLNDLVKTSETSLVLSQALIKQHPFTFLDDLTFPLSSSSGPFRL